MRGSPEATMGRLGHSVPLIFERVDNTPFLKSERWDSPEYLDRRLQALAMVWPGSELVVFGGRLGSIRGHEWPALLTAPVIRSFRTLESLRPRLALGASLRLQANSRVLFKGGYVYCRRKQDAWEPSPKFSEPDDLPWRRNGDSSSLMGLEFEGGVAKEHPEGGLPHHRRQPQRNLVRQAEHSRLGLPALRLATKDGSTVPSSTVTGAGWGP
jgi:hypothetical protein